jgi:crotonobetainyl-CoA:carnitine CoA-transferase CaiB-like acyl-CoA transferase
LHPDHDLLRLVIAEPATSVHHAQTVIGSALPVQVACAKEGCAVNREFPLEGVRVLDLSRVLAGPYAGRMLSDMGADVVKVEPPEGDITRFWGKVVAGLSGYYTQQNAGKRNISIDLRRPGAPELVRELASRADVVIENFRPGVLASYGLAYADLSRAHPRLIMLSISGYGQVGPASQRAAYAAVVHAETGLMARQGKMFRSGPKDLPVSIADMNAGLHGLSSVLAALFMRERTGAGQHIDLAMTDCMLATDDHVHLALEEESLERPFASEVWETAFGHVVLAGDFRFLFREAVAHCGLVDPTPPGASLEEKIAGRRRAFGEFLTSFPDMRSLGSALDRANIAWGQVLTTHQAVRSETSQHRNSVVETDDRAGGIRRVIQSPYRFSGAKSGLRGPAPFRGEHNASVLSDWLASQPTAIERLQSAGVLVEEKR